ncbi:lipopolysaccharide heptosyltransferase I [Halioglobus japonicus]|uniref:Lipopolysaccharide heptosyltransferase 1 n=1 Tax=Halioglobus japonicus TaxID=930805 RepID=A0AAP8SM44_9GAMM|nr:lipopolysaccharide heptosyltransferase I [Halioglobus japonicus]AQA17257.1 lipopolysaccharide heptosyltransferase I [Halioglobus japonicus]PLW85172.1 lipopolysaccharide heptosyltransferase I [Halioglobus japonicus]GHD19834.1 ADP-heptose--LPS heptosyltransferase [Halioglobus japonicus]
MRVLIVKMSSLGDVIHTLPAVTDAARAVPGIQFDWVVEEAFAEIPAWHPAVNRTLPIAFRRLRKRPLRNFTGPEWRNFRQQLRSRHYDLVIDAQGLLKSAFVARLAQTPIAGFDKHSAREGLAATAYHHKYSVPVQMHAVERTRRLFASVLGYSIDSERGDYGVRANLARTREKRCRGLMFFHGTARAEKLWPVAHWAELLTLADAAGYPVWLPWGSEEEKVRAAQIVAVAGTGRVLPRLDLRGLASMLLEVDGAVAVDTGLGHLAAALDVPTVSLYGPTDTALIGAYGQHQVHIQSPVGPEDTDDPLAMMTAISAADVWSKLTAVLPQEESA